MHHEILYYLKFIYIYNIIMKNKTKYNYYMKYYMRYYRQKKRIERFYEN